MRRIQIVWTAVIAAVLSISAVASGVISGDLTLALGLSAIVAALLSSRER
jgi:hypothetical protein